MKAIFYKITNLPIHLIQKMQFSMQSSLVHLLNQNNVPIEEVDINEKSNEVYLKLFAITIALPKFNFILLGYKYLKLLKCERNIELTRIEDRIQINIEGYKVFIGTAEELLILHEIFINGDYNIIASLTDKFVAIDIGMNVGMTSIFLSMNDSIKKIYAYEPFINTFEIAKENIGLNKSATNKISPYNFGLGKNNRKETWKYNYENKGSMGVNGLDIHFFVDPDKCIEEIVEIRDASDVFKEIINENPESKFIVKIDCEGSEYEIFEQLEDNNVLEKISAFMIEWHFKGPDLLVKQLTKNGFISFCFNEKHKVRGMIYSIKSTNESSNCIS